MARQGKGYSFLGCGRCRGWTVSYILKNLRLVFLIPCFLIAGAYCNDVNGMGHIDTLLRTCAAKGCDVIGLQQTKRDETFKISASGYRVFFSGNCSMVKGMKRQHGVGQAIKEEIVKKAGEDGITIECVIARLLKARISSKSNFVTFVVAYALTEEAPEGQKAEFMAAINCTVASVPAREYVFVLTAANTRTGKRGEGGGETDIKALGAYGRGKLNENGKLLLRKASKARVNRRLRRYYLVVLRLPNTFALACLLLSSI